MNRTEAADLLMAQARSCRQKAKLCAKVREQDAEEWRRLACAMEMGVAALEAGGG